MAPEEELEGSRAWPSTTPSSLEPLHLLAAGPTDGQGWRGIRGANSEIQGFLFLGMEPWDSHMLGKCSITVLYPRPLYL